MTAAPDTVSRPARPNGGVLSIRLRISRRFMLVVEYQDGILSRVDLAPQEPETGRPIGKTK